MAPTTQATGTPGMRPLPVPRGEAIPVTKACGNRDAALPTDRAEATDRTGDIGAAALAPGNGDWDL